MQWAKHQRRWFGKWHTYIGIIAGLIVSLVGATGSILVFEREIDEALNPEYYHIQPAAKAIDVGEVAVIIQNTFPQRRMISIIHMDKAWKVMLSQNEEVFIDPYSGAVNGKRPYESSFIQIVTQLHVNLMLSVPGKIIVGLATLSLLILTISGLRLWLPAKWKQLLNSA